MKLRGLGKILSINLEASFKEISSVKSDSDISCGEWSP